MDLPGHRWDTRGDLEESKASREAAELLRASVVSGGRSRTKGTWSEMPSRRDTERGVKSQS